MSGAPHPPVPRVSVVVPVYATEPYLPACLESLLAQTITDLEVIVVDDASPGAVRSVVDSVASGDPRVRVVAHERNGGLMRSRVSGARAAAGAYLGFVDSDDLVEPWFYESLLDAALASDADLVQCALTEVDVDGNETTYNRGGDAHVLRDDEVVRGLLVGRLSNSLCTKLIRIGLWYEVAESMDPTVRDVAYGEDLLTTLMLAARSRSFAHVPRAGYRYLRRAESITLASSVARITRHLADLDRVFQESLPVLAGLDAPVEDITAYYRREYVGAVRHLLHLARLAGTGAPVGFPDTAPELGLLAAVALDRWS